MISYAVSAPCKECQERTIGCHGSCLKYNDWKEDASAFNKKVSLEMLPQSVTWASQRKYYADMAKKRQLSRGYTHPFA